MEDVELLIASRTREIEPGVEVQRVLPAAQRRAVGPFVFLDQMGPHQAPVGGGADVRPHPHIGLSTVTYLFEGRITHRDSEGSLQDISPGDVNWMTAGRGIVHSERTPPDERARGPKLFGLQLWVGLPKALEEAAPSFKHYPSSGMPELAGDGALLRVFAGSAYGVKSPVAVSSPLFAVDVMLEAGGRLRLPEGHEERCAYVIEGGLERGTEKLPQGTLAVFKKNAQPELTATVPSRVVLLGGEPLDGPRYMFWNFVSSNKEQIVEAARAWKEGRFAKRVPGDEVEFVPLTMEPRFSTH